MYRKIVFAGLLLALAAQFGCGGQATSSKANPAQSTSTASVGWYNGDCQSGISGTANWYVSNQQFSRTYDDFVVPNGGWTVAGVFSNNVMAPSTVTEAVWEIRSGVSSGNAGTVIVSGRSAVTQKLVVTYPDGTNVYRIEADGLHTALSPGTYWLNVSPVVAQWPPAQSYVCATIGANAIGNPLGNDRNAFFNSSVVTGAFFEPVLSTGQAGTSGDVSQGVLIAR